jgi:hypothetical protein
MPNKTGEKTAFFPSFLQNFSVGGKKPGKKSVKV